MPLSAHTTSAIDEHQRFAVFYREHVAFVWRSLRRLGAPESMLEDLTQDVFLAAARRIDEFEGRSSAKTWLFGIAMRIWMTQRRSLWRHERKIEALAQIHQGIVSDPLASRDARRTLLDLLQQLDEDRRAVYVLTELEGHTAAEIAEGLGLNINTVSTRLRAARKSMREAAERLLTEAGEPSR